ncbi:MAG: large conductance mechanosensitive channel protein MscL [Chitinophagaceae bacterium]|nr:large conductance mechanosensitive channel protein MscL [Chitinophagaceae bacterium]
MLKEFKDFALKGNVMDLAVAVIIGGAFGKIVTSLVEDLLMPLIGLATGGVSFVDKFYAFDGKTYASLDEARKAGAGVFAYGSFIQSVIDFLIIAFCIFLIVKALNNIRKKEAAVPATPPAPSTTEKLLMEIRDSLQKR